MKFFTRICGLLVVFMICVSLIRANNESIVYKQPVTFEYLLQQFSDVKLVPNANISNSNWLVLMKDTVALLEKNNGSFIFGDNPFSFVLSKIGATIGKFIVFIFSSIDMFVNFIANTINVIYNVFNACYIILFGYVL